MRRWLFVALAVQVVLVLLVVSPRLLPTINGTEYRIAVEPVDPIDPFRGAYVDLSYGRSFFSYGSPDGRLHVPLLRRGGLWVAGRPQQARPERKPFLRCERNDGELDCGIGSFFASQREAKRLERELAGGGAVARVRIDGAGRAALVGLEPR
jgi:uncharacterized membrane-anchored protein